MTHDRLSVMPNWRWQLLPSCHPWLDQKSIFTKIVVFCNVELKISCSFRTIWGDLKIHQENLNSITQCIGNKSMILMTFPYKNCASSWCVCYISYYAAILHGTFCMFYMLILLIMHLVARAKGWPQRNRLRSNVRDLFHQQDMNLNSIHFLIIFRTF